MKKPTKCSAFNLTELLVVIAIIGILAALLLTAVSKSKAKAQQIQCANNVRQLGIGLRAFVADYHVYPLIRNLDYSAGNYPAGVHSWVSVLEETEFSGKGRRELRTMLSNNVVTVWHCPCANSFIIGTSTDKTAVNVISYGYNAYGLRRYQDPDSLGLGEHKGNTPTNYVFSTPISESEVTEPSEMMAIGDAFVGGNGVVMDVWDRLQRTSDLEDYYGSTKRSYARHQGRANVVFCDGHVESPTLKFLFEDTSDAALVRWNRDHLPHREKLSP